MPRTAVILPMRKAKPKGQGGVAAKYPWKKWITKTGTILTRGKDYKCSTQSFMVYAYMRSGRLNKKAFENGAKPQHLMLLKLDDNHVYIRLKKTADRAPDLENEIRQQFLAAKAVIKHRAKRKV